MTPIICPVAACRTANESSADECARCGTPLRSYTLLQSCAAHLFNQGLRAARGGHLSRARDCFAAVVHWCPVDLEARNALAAACLALRDRTEARRHWEAVLQRSAGDRLALQGLHALAALTSSRTAPAGRRRRRSRKRR
jgi:Flp pilus assembly protein TadD